MFFENCNIRLWHNFWSSFLHSKFLRNCFIKAANFPNYHLWDRWFLKKWSLIKCSFVPIFEYDLLCKLFWNQLLFTEKHIFLEGRSIPAKRILDIFGRVIKSIKHHQCTHNDLLHLGSRRIFLRLLLTLFK